MFDEIPVVKQEVAISEFDSSFKEQTYIVSYEGRNWQISEFLYHILALINGVNSIKQITDLLSEQYGRIIDEQQIYEAVYGKFEKIGILEGAESLSTKEKGVSDFLWCKINLIKSESVLKFKFLAALFHQRIYIPLVILSSIIPVLLIYTQYNTKIFSHILEADAVGLLYFLIISLIAVLSHEFGHMAACMKYDVKPGNIGFAFYFVQPVMYSDVSRTWKLSRRQRAVIDLGGVYFESIVLSVLWVVGYFSHNTNITLAVAILSIALIINFNPFIKMDGYWIFSDLSGIPNLHKMMSTYIQMKIRSFFGVKSEDVVGNIKGTERKFFYLYTFLGVFFIFFFAYGFVSAFQTLLVNWTKIAALFSGSILQADVSIGTRLMMIGKMLYQAAMYVLTIVLLVRIVFVVLKSSVLGIYRLVLDIAKAKKEQQAMTKVGGKTVNEKNH